MTGLGIEVGVLQSLSEDKAEDGERPEILNLFTLLDKCESQVNSRFCICLSYQ